MKISVITPSLNAAATIGYTVESFLGQSYKDAELLIIDGESDDRTVQLVKSFGSDRIKVHETPPRGIFNAMNMGLRLFAGDAVGVLNADDKFHDPEVLGDIAQALGHHDVVHGHIDMISAQNTSKIIRRWRSGPYYEGSFRRGWMPAHPSFYVRRRVIDEVGAFDETMRIAGDYDFMLRVLEVGGFTPFLLERVMVDMAYGGASTRGPGAYWTGNVESLISRQKWLGAGPIDLAFFAKPLRKVKQWINV